MVMRRGLTLVEILIVVLIVGILAALVVPQFTQATGDAHTNALCKDLQTVRNVIQVYRVQHVGNYPGANLVAALMGRSNLSGAIGTDPNTFPLGPYLREFPANGFAGNNGVKTTGSAGSGTEGWWYDPVTGTFCPNDPAHTGM